MDYESHTKSKDRLEMSPVQMAALSELRAERVNQMKDEIEEAVNLAAKARKAKNTIGEIESRTDSSYDSKSKFWGDVEKLEKLQEKFQRLLVLGKDKLELVKRIQDDIKAIDYLLGESNEDDLLRPYEL